MRDYLRPARPVLQIGGKPRGWSVRRSGDWLQIQYSQRSFEVLSLGLVCAAIAVSTAGSVLLSFSLVRILLFLIVFPVAGAGTIFAAALWWGWSVIEVSPQRIAVSTPCFPRAKRREIPAAEVTQLDVNVYAVGARWGELARVRVFLSDGRRMSLGLPLFGERAADGARFIEREVERHLKIKDQLMSCPQCGYDVRASKRRCPECGIRLRGRRSGGRG